MKRLLIATWVALLSGASPAQGGEVTGYWREPGGSVIRIEPCGGELCARLVALSASAPSRVDAHNPDPTRRSRPLCGLVLGQGFRPFGPDRAQGGKLYDPKSGHTYNGAMTAVGDALYLRGYIGWSVLGRTEVWSRLRTTPAPCAS